MPIWTSKLRASKLFPLNANVVMLSLISQEVMIPTTKDNKIWIGLIVFNNFVFIRESTCKKPFFSKRNLGQKPAESLTSVPGRSEMRQKKTLRMLRSSNFWCLSAILDDCTVLVLLPDCNGGYDARWLWQGCECNACRHKINKQTRQTQGIRAYWWHIRHIPCELTWFQRTDETIWH